MRTGFPVFFFFLFSFFFLFLLAAPRPPPIAAPPPVPTTTEDAVKFPNIAKTGIEPKVQNVVSMFNLSTKVNLKQIALHAKNSEYNPKRFAAVIMRVREPKTTALIFASGKVVVTGASTEELSRKAAKRFAKIIRKLGYDDAKFKDFKVHNLVGSCAVPFPLRLEFMAAKYSMWATYDSEIFPGLIFRMESPKVVLMIFASGKIVFAGAKSGEQMKKVRG